MHIDEIMDMCGYVVYMFWGFLQGYYYFAMVEDFLLRFAWMLVVTVGEGGHMHGQILKSVLASLEVFRLKTVFHSIVVGVVMVHP